MFSKKKYLEIFQWTTIPDLACMNILTKTEPGRKNMWHKLHAIVWYKYIKHCYIMDVMYGWFCDYIHCIHCIFAWCHSFIVSIWWLIHNTIGRCPLNLIQSLQLNPRESKWTHCNFFNGLYKLLMFRWRIANLEVLQYWISIRNTFQSQMSIAVKLGREHGNWILRCRSICFKHFVIHPRPHGIIVSLEITFNKISKGSYKSLCDLVTWALYENQLLLD